MLNLHHLELFYYVAKAGGITAGLRLIPYGIQQPAVSSQLSRLEASFGTRLFHRRPFSLTPAGREVFETVAPFFGSMEGLARRVRLEANEHFRLAASASVLREHLPSLLKRMQRKSPELRVTLREANQQTAERMLQEHEVDLAVTLQEGKAGQGIRCEPLLKIPMILLVSGESEWRTSANILRALKGSPPPLIALPGREYMTRVFHTELSKRGTAWPTRIESISLELIEAYVEHGFGIGLSLAVPGHVPPAGLRVISLPGFPKLTFSAFWSGRLPAPAETFLELARAEVTNLVGR